MTSFILLHETTIRLGFFLTALCLMGLWELKAPYRPLKVEKRQRWLNNLSLVVFNSVTLRLVIPIAATSVAIVAQQQGWGLFNMIEIDNSNHLLSIAVIITTIISLDFIIYLQHRLMHKLDWLWRLHRVHHADMDIDVTTGSRFHPVEIIFSMLVKLISIVLIGAPAIAVILFEIILSSMALFNHSNIKLPKPIDRLLRYIFITPDMHRVHHSTQRHEENSNFGFSLSCWDKLFRTYVAQPEKGHLEMTIGNTEFNSEEETVTVSSMLKMPFVKRKRSV